MIDKKTKSLVGIGVSHAVGCKVCFDYHKNKAIKYGATKEEIDDSVTIAEKVNLALRDTAKQQKVKR